MKQYIYWIIIGLAALFILFRGKETVTLPPRITTVHDTVKVIDTLWIKKLQHDTVYKVNIVERVVVTPPETIVVVPNLAGLTALHVPQKLGDSTLAYGFKIGHADSSYTLDYWEYQYWTPGPLRSFVLVGDVPAVAFYPPAPQCDIRCKAKWGGGIYLGIELIRSILGKP